MRNAVVKVKLARDLRAKNKMAAAELRSLFAGSGVFVLNILGSPGAGKTTLLEASLPRLAAHYRIAVIEGDLYTARDAERLAQNGVDVVQINTEGGCHLDAPMIGGAVRELPLEQLDLLIIENVGNLVCPAGFDLGEDARAVVLSVTEGDDKPDKYPQIFAEADVIVLNKLDLLPYVRFDLRSVQNVLGSLNPAALVLPLSAVNGSGLDRWLDWVKQLAEKKKRGDHHGCEAVRAR